jgi:biopolymer transport protein ExbD
MTLVLCVSAAVLPAVGCAEEPKTDRTTEDSLLKTAQQTYDLLLEKYRSGKVSGPLYLELLNNWSKRIMLARVQMPSIVGRDRAGLMQEGHNEHTERMRELQQVVQKLAGEGKAMPAEVAAAAFFRLEGDALVAQINEAIDEIHGSMEERDLDVVLPAPGEAKPLVAQPMEVIVNISSDGRYYVSGKELDSQELEELLRQASVNHPGSQSVVIRAHKDTRFERVVLVMDLCNKTRINNYKITVSKDDPR